MTITLVTSTLGGGGAERVVATMANHWAEKQRKVTILTTFSGNPSSNYALHPRVTHLQPGSPPFSSPIVDSQESALLLDLINSCSQPEREALIPQATRILKLRRAILSTRPKVVISYMDFNNNCVLSATRDLSLPVIVSEHCDPNHNSIGEGWHRLRRRLYPQASCVTVLTEESLRFFSSIPGIRGRVIPNPLTPSVFSSSDEMPPQKNGKTLMAMGRLSSEKGFDLLLSAFSVLAARHPEWTLEILGEGPLRGHLESRIQKLGLAGRVRMPGFTLRPFDALRRADLFAMSSLCEGFPNALLEAMACGLAVVSFDCPSGPRHIIRNGVDGVLVPPRNDQAMAAALDRLMGDEAERKRLAARGPEVAERFGVERVMSMWEELISDCAK
ncbi:MAG TPA: glycosyltransferase family 4 protein [Blastocatellia bacterium]|nr:glycosyltransferase family 4 protein [Blastocatellia bacterium]